MNDSSWIWDEIENDTLDNYNTCESVTNHWLYFVFSGYILPLISPRVRDWLKQSFNTLKNNKVTGNIVTLTEFGFEKIQEIEKNDEMKDYIKRLCSEKNPELYYTEETFEKIAWLFSGETKDGKDGIQQTWKKLNKIIDENGIKIVRP